MRYIYIFQKSGIFFCFGEGSFFIYFSIFFFLFYLSLQITLMAWYKFPNKKNLCRQYRKKLSLIYIYILFFVFCCFFCCFCFIVYLKRWDKGDTRLIAGRELKLVAPSYLILGVREDSIHTGYVRPSCYHYFFMSLSFSLNSCGEEHMTEIFSFISDFLKIFFFHQDVRDVKEKNAGVLKTEILLV